MVEKSQTEIGKELEERYKLALKNPNEGKIGMMSKLISY